MTRILLVDDEDNNLDMLKRRLERRGYEVATATNGIEACQVFPRVVPDLVLMDMHMPELDGYEATRRLRATAAGAAVPIIGLTVLAMAGDRERVLEAGCDEYSTKPVVMDELLEKINHLLQGGAATNAPLPEHS